MKIHKVARTRLEEKNMRSLEETRLRSEDVGLGSIFDDDDDGSVTSMEIIKDEVIFRIQIFFFNNILNHFGSKTLTGIACTSFDTMIKFMRLHIYVYFISKKDKDHQNDVISCIYDDVVTGLKNELSLFMKETKMAAKKQHDVNSINKKITLSKSKSTIISPPIFDSSIETFSISEVKKKNNEEALVVNQEKKNNNVEVDPKKDSISKTSSDESSDESSGIVNKNK